MNAQTLEVLSSAASDDGAGLGARTVEVQGLDGDYEPLTETVTLDGVTPVLLTGTFLRVFRAKIIEVGSGGTNGGTITVRASGGGTTYAQIAPGACQTNMALFTVRAGYRGFITSAYFSASNPNTTAVYDFEIRVREYSEGILTPFALKQDIRLADAYSSFIRKFDIPIMIPEKSDIRIIGTSDSINTRMICAFDMVLMNAEPLND